MLRIVEWAYWLPDIGEDSDDSMELVGDYLCPEDAAIAAYEEIRAHQPTRIAIRNIESGWAGVLSVSCKRNYQTVLEIEYV